MQGVTSAIQTEGQNAVSASGAIAEDIKNQFNFTVRPTIAPRLIEPGAAVPKAEAIGKQSSRPAGRSFAQHNTFHINGGDPRAAAREMERRLARLGNSNNALFDAVPT